MPSATPLVIQTVKQVTVVSFSEPSIVDARSIEAIRAELIDLVEKQDKHRLIIDLSTVQYLSSSALGVLVPLHKMCVDRKGSLILCGLRKEILKIFKLTGLNKMLNICKSESAALKEFGVTIE